jgi:anti-anti-sigma regulatory factor
VTPTSAILFPSAEYVRERVMQSKDTQGVSCKVVVFDCQRINQIDFTAAKCLLAFISDFKKVGRELVFYRPKKSVAKIITKIAEGGVKMAETDTDLSEILKGWYECIVSKVLLHI